VNRKIFIWRRLGGIAAVCAALLMSTVATGRAEAQIYTTLHNFTGTDGKYPDAGLIRDSSGNLYGTSQDGGSSTACDLGCGTVFKIDSSGTLTVLHSFGTAANDGINPFAAGLVLDSSGNLYGTTYRGGSQNAGTVFKIPAAGGTLTVLHSFGTAASDVTGTPTTDGGYPNAGLVLDSSGNLYGTTLLGGLNGCTEGCGTVFKLDTSGQLTVLHSFDDGSVLNDGVEPHAGLVLDASGNLYGTTYGGGYSYGIVFKIPAAGGTLTVLHSFGDSTVTNDGANPAAGLILDASGNLYGTTGYGGSANAGTVFKIPAAGGTLAVLHSFGSVAYDGANPAAGLVLDSSGNLYGTTYYGGSANQGTVFKMPGAGGTLTVLHNFGDGTVANDGSNPYAGLLLDPSGILYGTTLDGGSSCIDGCGTVFEIAATPQAATQIVMNQVNALYAQKVLNSGQHNSLITELQQAISLMKKGKKAGAMQNVQYFISEVQDLESSGVLTSSQAEPLISEANGVIAELQ
jgi:uncharacterized repeat protein (TIGR03803 family)